MLLLFSYILHCALYHYYMLENQNYGSVFQYLFFQNVGISPEFHSFTGAYSPGRTFGLPFRGFLITHTVGLLLTSDQPVAEASTYTGQHNI
jgi:hypothetical protein